MFSIQSWSLSPAIFSIWMDKISFLDSHLIFPSMPNSVLMEIEVLFLDCYGLFLYVSNHLELTYIQLFLLVTHVSGILIFFYLFFF